MQFTAYANAVEVDGDDGLLVGAHACPVLLALQLAVHLHLARKDYRKLAHLAALVVEAELACPRGFAIVVDDGNHVCGAYLHVRVVGIAWEDEGTQSVNRIHAHGLPLDPVALVACVVSRVAVVVRAVCQLSVGICGL